MIRGAPLRLIRTVARQGDDLTWPHSCCSTAPAPTGGTGTWSSRGSARPATTRWRSTCRATTTPPAWPSTPMRPWPLDRWPDVPTRFLLCRQDRFFPADFLRRVVTERLGIVPDEIDGGHLPALARPAELSDRLLAYERESASAG